MKRDTDKNKWNIAQKLSSIILQLDRLVFPENPIQKIFCITGKPRDTEFRRLTCYGPRKENSDGQPEHYAIFSYRLNRNVDEELKARMKGANSLNNKTWNHQTALEEMFVSVAAHEIRHRLQEHSLIQLFSSANAKKINIPGFKTIMKEVESYLAHRPARDYKKEFDAEIIDLYVTFRLYSGEKDLSEIARIIKLEPQNLYNKRR